MTSLRSSHLVLVFLLAAACGGKSTPSSAPAETKVADNSTDTIGSSDAPAWCAEERMFEGYEEVVCENLKASDFACEQASDCVVFSAATCECASAGPWIAVNKDRSDAINAEIGGNGDWGCDCNEVKAPACVDNQCVVQ